MCMNMILFIEKEIDTCPALHVPGKGFSLLLANLIVTLEDEKPGRGPLIMETGERLELQWKAGFRKAPGEPGLPSLLPQGARDTQYCF